MIKFFNTLVNSFKRTNRPLISTILALATIAPVTLMGSSAQAAGDAYFNLSPSSGSYNIGDTITVSVSETSTSSDNTDAVEADLSYSSSLLKYDSLAITGPFSLCPKQSGGSGVVNIDCASISGSVSGTQNIAQITFSALASGNAPVSMTSGSNIDNSSGSSVWNGVLPSASFVVNTPASTPPPSGGSGNPPPPPSGSKSSGSSSSTGSSKSTSSTGTSLNPNAGQPTTTTNTSSTTNKNNSSSVGNKNNTVASLSSKISAKNDNLVRNIVGISLIPVVIAIGAWFILIKHYRFSFLAQKPYIKFFKK